MTRPSKMLGQVVAEKYVRTLDNGCLFFCIEADLARKYGDAENSAGFAPLTTFGGDENVGVWARFHGTDDGLLWYTSRNGVSPREIRKMADELWGHGVAIVLTCCYPKQVKERLGKELSKYRIYLLASEYTGMVYTQPFSGNVVTQQTSELWQSLDNKRKESNE